MISSAPNGTITAGADFVAGFVYGMTGDNNLTEIEACYQGGPLLFSEVEAGIADIKKGGWNNDVQAALQFGLVALQVPAALKTCEAMGDDIAAIETWAKIFTDPSALVKQVSKHYLFHKAEITSDISALEGDWTNALYWKAGVDLADLLTLAVGPIQSSNGLPLPPVDSVPDFTAGLIYGFTGNDHREELEACMTDVEPIADDAKKVFADLKAVHILAAVKDIGNIFWLLPDATASCGELSELQADIDVMLAWAEIFKSPTKAAKIASKNWLFHGVEIKKDIADEEAAWAAKDYFTAGDSTAKGFLRLVPESSMDVDLPLVQALLQ